MNFDELRTDFMNNVLLMIRPVDFDFNSQTAVNNAFQVAPQDYAERASIQIKALQEFDGLVQVLKDNDIEVMVIQDTPEPHTPDSIFPNNWISFHPDGTLVYYPMFAENRRKEKKPAIINEIKNRFEVRTEIDFSSYAEQGIFLEGTGSFVLDRENHVAYACISPRTDQQLFKEFCVKLGYEPVIFEAFDVLGVPVYHTNVLMCIADNYAVINLIAIPPGDRERVVEKLEDTGKKIIDINQDQMAAFAGNMLQVRDRKGNTKLVMSSQAYSSLTPEQREELSDLDTLIHAPLDSIEKYGGGSARCMMAEIILQ